jgi:hypothetical protein
MFAAELYFEGKPFRRLSPAGQLFCHCSSPSHAYPASRQPEPARPQLIDSAPVKKQGNSLPTRTVKCLVYLVMHCFVDLCRGHGEAGALWRFCRGFVATWHWPTGISLPIRCAVSTSGSSAADRQYRQGRPGKRTYSLVWGVVTTPQL